MRCYRNRLRGWLERLRIGTIAPQCRNRRIKSLDFLLCSLPLLLQLLDYFRHVSYRRRRRRFWLGFWLRLVLLWKLLRPVDHQLLRHF